MSFQIIYEAPAQMILSERSLLYALIYGLRPSVALEIGTAEGGSAMIICAAMDAAGCGRLICVDPTPRIAPEHLARIAHRASVLAGSSSETISRASELAGSRFDFVFVDGDHSYVGVWQDIETISPVLNESGYVLFHDAHHFEVEQAIDEALKRYPFIDCGLLSVEANSTNEFHLGRRVVWGGLRLLRFSPSSRSARDQELPPAQPAQTQTELDILVSRARERLGKLSGWHGALLRKTCKLSYRMLLECGKLMFR